MKTQVKHFIAGLLVAIGVPALAATFNQFSPATGVLKGNASTYVTTAAVSADIRGLWSGTCDATTFLRGDGACAATAGGTVTSVGLTMPTGFSVGGSPVTTSGTLAVTTTLNGVIHGNGSGFTASNVNLASEVTGTLPVGNGGTGATTITGLVLGNGASPFTAYGGNGCTNQFIRSLSATGVATCNSVSLTADVTGTLPFGNGGTGLSTALDDTTLISSGSAWVATAVPNCTDTGGNHLNYTTATNSFSCGTSGSTTFANPTASVGLTAVNGVATTAMRSDAAPALSQSISPTWSGTHTWSNPLQGPDGTALAPAYRFSSDPDNGLYLSSANEVSIAAGGAQKLAVGTVGIFPLVPVQAGIGAVGSPSFSFLLDSDTGIYRSASNEISFAAGGAQSLAIGTAAVYPIVPVQASDGSAAAPGYSFLLDPDTGLYRAGSGDIHYSSNNSDQGSLVGMSTGSFTITYTGMTTTVTGTANYVKIGTQVMLVLPAATGTSNAATFTGTGVPAAIQPSTLTQRITCGPTNAGAVAIGGGCQVSAASGTITFEKLIGDGGSTWTNSGTKGFAVAQTIAYVTN